MKPSIRYIRFRPLILALLMLQIVSTNSNAQDTAKRLNGYGIQNSENLGRYINDDTKRSQLPLFFQKEGPVGSPYLSNGWMRGVLELSTHQVIPPPHEVLWFNFDKVRSLVITANNEGKIKYYSIDSISHFALVDSNDRTYEFEKLPKISKSHFLMPLVKSANGYSLYKRLFTRVTNADYQNIGYYSTGKKYDTYTDYYQYFLLLPGNDKFEKFSLERKYLDKIFRQHSDELNIIYLKYDRKITEEALVELIGMINGRL